MKLTLLLIIITLILTGCASQKSVQDTTPEKTYISDNIVAIEEVPIDDDTIVPETKIHIVQKGESLWVIAKKYGVSVQDIVKANNIEDASLIKINQELIIPGERAIEK